MLTYISLYFICLSGGYCDLKEDKLKGNIDQLSPLQSWGPELRYFTRLNERPIVEGHCDIVIQKPTYIMKIDASKLSSLIIL